MIDVKDIRRLEDMLSPDEERLVEYYRSHPGEDWVTAAMGLGLEEKMVCNMSFRLVFMVRLRAVQRRGDLDPMQFEVNS